MLYDCQYNTHTQNTMLPEKSKYSFRRVGKQMGGGALRVGKFGDPMSRMVMSMAMRNPALVAKTLNPF